MAAMPLGRGCRALMAAAKGPSLKTASSSSSASTKPSCSNTGLMKTVSVSSQLGSFLGTTSPSNVRLMKTVSVSSQLRSFIGTTRASPGDSIKKIWDYIKLHNLQNPGNKEMIFCDDKLKTIFAGKETVRFGEIATLLSQHFSKSRKWA